MFSFPTVSKFSSQLKPEFRSLVLDNETTYLEEAVYSLFRVDATDLISIKAQLSKAFSIQPSEIDKMAFWEFELFVKEMERLTKEEQDQQKKEFDTSGAQDAMKMAKPGYMQKMMQNQANMMPKVPNMNMQMPKVIKMPSGL